MKTKNKYVIVILLALLVSMEALMAIKENTTGSARKPVIVKNNNGLSTKTSAGGASNLPAWMNKFSDRLNLLGAPSGIGGGGAPIPNFNTPQTIASGQQQYRIKNDPQRQAGGYGYNVPNSSPISTSRGTFGQAQGQSVTVPSYITPRGSYGQAQQSQAADNIPVNPIVDGPVVDPQTQPGGYAFPYIDRGIKGQKSIIPYNGMTDPLGTGSGFGSRYGGNWGRGGGGGYGGYDGYSSLPAWYLNLVNWNIR